jgi:serine protease inhibitor
MKIYIDGKIIDPNKTPVILCFENDEDVAVTVNDLTDERALDGPRFHGLVPDDYMEDDKRLILNRAKHLYFTTLAKERDNA